MTAGPIIVELSEPIGVGDRQIAAIVLREPVAREFVDLGQVYASTPRSSQVRATAPVSGSALRYLRRCAEPGAIGLDDVLAAASLADGIAIERALARLLPEGLQRADVTSNTAALAFDWKLMSIREADALPISELVYTCRRLGDHVAARKSRGS